MAKYKTKDYARWQNMLQRCRNKSHHHYPGYGGRGIVVCERWLTFKNFLEDMGPCPEGLSIDRIDNEGPYSKENCRYTDQRQQAWNKRTTVWIEAFGERLPREVFCKKHRIGTDTLNQRMASGLTAEEALKVINKSFKLDDSKVIDIQQKYSTGNFCLHELAKEYGVGTMTIHRVVHNKYWSAA